MSERYLYHPGDFFDEDTPIERLYELCPTDPKDKPIESVENEESVIKRFEPLASEKSDIDSF